MNVIMNSFDNSSTYLFDSNNTSIQSETLPDPCRRRRHSSINRTVHQDYHQDALDFEKPQPVRRNSSQWNVACPKDSSASDSSSSISVCEDSPYYQTFVHNEICSLEIVCSIMKDINQKAKAFVVAGTEMTNAMRNLSMSCQLRSSIAAGTTTTTTTTAEGGMGEDILLERIERVLGSETAAVLQRLGQVLEKIAKQQESMCNAVESALDSHLEEITRSESKIAKTLQEEANQQTKQSDSLFRDYLNKAKPKSASVPYEETEERLGGDDIVCTTTPAALHQPRLYFLGSRASSVPNIFYNNTRNKSNCTTTTTSSSSSHTNNNHKNQKRHSFNSAAFSNHSESTTTTTTTTTTYFDGYSNKDPVSKMEKNVCLEQISAEIKRFHLYKYLIDAKRQRTLQLSRSLRDAFLGIHTYFVSGQEMTESLNTYIHTNYQQYEELQFFYNSNDKLSWQNTEHKLSETWKRIEKMQFGPSLEEEPNRSRTRNKEEDSIMIMEDDESYSLWNLPYRLSECSPKIRNHGGFLSSPSSCSRRRESILLEGWLYQRCSIESISSLFSSPWIKRWFVLKKDGLYCVETQLDDDDNNNNNERRRRDSFVPSGTEILPAVARNVEVPICDLTSCTVSLLNDGNHHPRLRSSRSTSSYCLFGLELSFLNRKPILLQARGPKEVRAWANAIAEVKTNSYVPIAL